MLSGTFASAVRSIVGGRRGGRTGLKLAAAFALGAGLAYAPTLGLGQGNKGQTPTLPPQAKAPLGGDDVALVRVVKKDNAVDTYAGGTDRFLDETPPATFSVPGGTPGKTIDVSASIPTEYLLQFEGGTGPIEVIGVSVLLRAGSNTCIWDCYWANGKKICECIRI